MTAAGSNARSKIFYNKVKGELEENLKSLKLNTTLVFQPSLLLGDREEFRMGEKIGSGIAKLTGWITPLAYRAIAGKSVAQSMVKETNDSKQIHARNWIGGRYHETESYNLSLRVNRRISTIIYRKSKGV